MGFATPRLDFSVDAEEYVIPKTTRIDSHTGYKCSAYSCAYLIRHQGQEMYGENVHEVMTDKMEGGYVYPKGIVKFIESNDFSVEYHIGNLAALKNEVAKGNPVIVMIKIRPDRDWLHYVPVVGYTPTAFLLQNPSPNCAMPFLPSTTEAFPPLIFLSCGIHRHLRCHFIATHSFPLTNNQPIEDHLSIE